MVEETFGQKVGDELKKVEAAILPTTSTPVVSTPTVTVMRPAPASVVPVRAVVEEPVDPEHDPKGRFLICLPYTLVEECPFPHDWKNMRNYSNDPGDPGGGTFAGITHTEYDIWRKTHGELTQDIRLLSRNQTEGYSIYYAYYWMPHCDALPPGLDLQFFDASVNEGSHQAVKILQVALHVTPDGNWGPLTIAAFQKLNNSEAVKQAVEAFTARRAEVYRQTRNFTRFGKDWLGRDSRIGAEALKMVEAVRMATMKKEQP